MPVTTLKALNNQQTFLRILIFSVVTIILWIAFSVFRSQQTPQISDELQQMALPLNPNLNLDIIGRINQKKAYSEAELSNFPIYLLTSDRSGNESISVLNAKGQAAPVATESDLPKPAPTLTPAQQTIINDTALSATDSSAFAQ